MGSPVFPKKAPKLNIQSYVETENIEPEKKKTLDLPENVEKSAKNLINSRHGANKNDPNAKGGGCCTIF